MDRLILAKYRAGQLAALIATRLEAMTADDTADDLSPTRRDELGGLGLVAVQIRQLIAESTRAAGAYFVADPRSSIRRAHARSATGRL